MKWRDLIAVAAAWALAWPVAAQAGRKRVGILMSRADTDPRERQSIRIFSQTVQPGRLGGSVRRRETAPICCIRPSMSQLTWLCESLPRVSV